MAISPVTLMTISVLTQGAERYADLPDEELQLLSGGEVAALIYLGEGVAAPTLPARAVV